MQRRLQYAMKARRHGVARGDSPATRVSLQSDDDARAGGESHACLVPCRLRDAPGENCLFVCVKSARIT